MPPVIEPDLRAVALKINQLYRPGMTGDRLYEITRQAWKTVDESGRVELVH